MNPGRRHLRNTIHDGSRTISIDTACPGTEGRLSPQYNCSPLLHALHALHRHILQHKTYTDKRPAITNREGWLHTRSLTQPCASLFDQMKLVGAPGSCSCAYNLLCCPTSPLPIFVYQGDGRPTTPNVDATTHIIECLRRSTH